jgi:hypothetical protein
VRLPGSSPAFIGLRHHSNGSTYRFYPRTRFSTVSFRDCSYFLMFRPLSLLASQIVPTAANFRAGQPRLLHPSRTCVVAFARIGHAIRPTTGNWRNEDLHLARLAAVVGCSRMMPTFPSKIPYGGFSPVRLSRPEYQTRAFPANWFAIILRTLCCHRYSRLCVRADALVSTSVRADLPLYPRGPRSGPGYAVPVHPLLSGPIRPTRRLISTSPPRGLYPMPSLCIFAYA